MRCSRFSLSLFAMVGIGGCSSVLDLEQARLVGDGGQQSVQSTPLLGECTQAGVGCACRDKCTDERAACLAHHGCRSALETYSICIGSQCVDTSDESCLEGLGLAPDPGNPASTLLDCLHGDACSQTECHSVVATICERYCGCMQDDVKCASKAEPVWHSDFQDCVAECQAVPLLVARCRLAHCEFAAASNVHCDHALARVKSLDQCATVDPDRAPVCLSAGEEGFPCNEQTPCCPTLQCTGAICKR